MERDVGFVSLGEKIVKKCKKSVKKCNYYCIYGFFFVPLQRISIVESITHKNKLET